MKRRQRTSIVHSPLLICIATAFGLGLSAARADVVLVESRAGGQNVGAYAEGTGNWQNSSAKSTVATTGIGSRFATQDGATFSVTPDLEFAEGTYDIEITHPTSSNIPTDLQVGVSVTGAEGLPATTDVFNQAQANTWRFLGTMTLDPGVTRPTLTFTKLPGASGTGQRFYADAIRFSYRDDPCRQVPQIVTVNGPLAEGQTYVDVPTVLSNATAVTVYANDFEIGRRTTNITGGVVRVPTSALVKGATITATQSSNSVESCLPLTGALVGGGANTRIRVSLSFRQNTTLTGPIGAYGGTTNLTVKFLGAGGVFGGGFGLAPTGGKVIEPSPCWQTVTFLRGTNAQAPVDPTYAWAGSDGTTNLLGDFAALDAIALAIDDLTDTGPYRIYIDNFMNGGVMVQDFEGATAGDQTVMFNQPSFSGSTSPFLLAQPPGSIVPNVSRVTSEHADTGANSLEVSWQFKDSSGGNWVRLVAQGSDTPAPQIDLNQPVSFRILVLPVEPMSVPLHFTSQPQSQTVAQGEPAVVSVGACGTAPLSYQWYFNGAPLEGETNRFVRLDSANTANSGAYYAVVTDASGSITSSVASVEVVAVSEVMSLLWSLAPGDRPYLTDDNTQRGLAYSPLTGNLLLVSRAPSDAILVLDGETGVDEGSLDLDPLVVNGGTFRVNQVGVTSDGIIYAANLTTDASVDEFRIYQWFDEAPGTTPLQVWGGNPGGVNDTNRWGDTMDVRDQGEPVAPEIIVASRYSNKVAVMRPYDSPTAALTFVVSGAPAGAFAQGLAWGAGNTFWGKSLNGALYHVALDFGAMTATVLHVYENVGSLAPIGVDAANQLLGGVAVTTPDSLRLYDISDLAAGPIGLDTENFPTDNPNLNATGAVDFGPSRVYALDSNNGLLAMSILQPPVLRYDRSGNELILMWSGPFVLQQASSINGTFMDVEGASSPHPVDLQGATEAYFRLRN